MAERRNRFEEPLKALASQKGMIGAVLLTRDGLCVMSQCPSLASPETFSAMTAAVVGAAETALIELGSTRTPRIIVEGEKHRLVAVAVTDELLLVGIAGRETRVEDIASKLESAAANLSRLATASTP